MNIDKNSPAWKEVQVIWHQGMKFRGAIAVEPATDEFANSMTRFVAEVLEAQSLSKTEELRPQLAAWKAEAVNRFATACKDERNYCVSPEALSIIRSIRDFFLVTCVDKNPQSLSILCMQDYMRRLSDHMQSSTYKPCQQSVANILQEHKRFNHEFGCTHHDALPYIYIIPKLHKDPSRPFDRFIAGHSHLNYPAGIKPSSKPSASLDSTSTRVSEFLNGVIDVLLLQDQRNIRRGEIK